MNLLSNLMRDRRLIILLIANISSSIGTGITMIAVPWLLVNRENGEEIYGYAALSVTIFLFFLSPYIGVLVDRYSRKAVLLLNEWTGMLIVACFAIAGFSAGEFHTWHLIGIYMGGTLYYTIHYPAQFAFNQEIFERSQYRTLNSVMEIQSQVASMVAGGLASLVIERTDLSILLLIDATTHIIGLALLSIIPYTTSHSKGTTVRISMFSDMKEGFSYLKGRPLLVLFYISSLMPFIGVMVGNYLWPIYIAKSLQADATVLGLADMIYAIGAVLAGFTIPLMMKRWGAYVTVFLSVTIFTVGLLIAAWTTIIVIFLGLKILLGWGNAGARVARNTVMMDLVPNALIGRVNSFFSAVGMGMRVVLVSLFTQSIHYTGASISLTIVGILLIVSILGVIMSRSILQRDYSTQV